MLNTNLVDEAGLADVGEAADDDGPGVRVNGGKTGQMLPHLLQVLQVWGLTFHDGSHSEINFFVTP